MREYKSNLQEQCSYLVIVEILYNIRLSSQCGDNSVEIRSAVPSKFEIMPIFADIQPFIFCSTMLNEIIENRAKRYPSLPIAQRSSNLEQEL